MLKEIMGRRRVFTALPAIGGAVGLLPAMAAAAIQAPLLPGDVSRKITLLPLRAARHWNRVTVIGFGRSGYAYLERLDQAQWSDSYYLAMVTSEGCEIPCVLDPEAVFDRHSDSSSDCQNPPITAILVGDILDPPFLKSARLVARVARAAGHTIIAVPAALREGAYDTSRMADAFGKDAACVTLPCRLTDQDDNIDMRLLLLEMDVVPFAIALETYGSAAVAARLKAAPGTYRTSFGLHSWAKTDPLGLAWDRLTDSCMGDIQGELLAPELLSLRINPQPTKKLRSKIIRAAHRILAPAKPLIAMRSERYNSGNDYCLEIYGVTRLG